MGFTGTSRVGGIASTRYRTGVGLWAVKELDDGRAKYCKPDNDHRQDYVFHAYWHDCCCLAPERGVIEQRVED
jgi:hypothetical protein